MQTADSVNGFADPFSVLLRDGVKRTTPTRWPDALVIDPTVLASAPAEMNVSGLGDQMAMFTATADWYLASLLGAGTLRRRSGLHRSSRAHPREGRPAGRTGRSSAGADGLAELARILTLSGIAMGIAGHDRSGFRHGARRQPPDRDGHRRP